MEFLTGEKCSDRKIRKILGKGRDSKGKGLWFEICRDGLGKDKIWFDMSLPFKKIRYSYSVIMTYYEYAINYRLSYLLTISTCILFWNPAGWNVNYVLLGLHRFPPGFTSGLCKVDGEAWDVVVAVMPQLAEERNKNHGSCVQKW